MNIYTIKYRRVCKSSKELAEWLCQHLDGPDEVFLYLPDDTEVAERESGIPDSIKDELSRLVAMAGGSTISL